MTGPDADRSEIAAFVGALLRYADEGTFVSLRTFTHNPADPPFAIEGIKINGAELAEVTQTAFDMAATAARYSQPLVFCPPVCTFNNKTRAREQDLANGLDLSVEIDVDAVTGLALLRGLIGPPTVVVASGGSWTGPTGEVQPKLHAHWRLLEPTRTPDEHAKLKRARRLAAAIVGGDHSNIPTVHPIRWPGSVHRKGTPKLCRRVELNEDAEVDLDDALDTLEVAVAARGISFETARGGGDGEPRETAGLIAEIMSARSYHAPLVALSARLAGSGLTQAKIVEMLQGLMQAVPRGIRDGDQPGRWQARHDEIPRIADSAVRKFGSGTEFDFSEDGLALEMGRKWTDARYVEPFGKWMFFDGARWERDERLLHLTRTRDFLRGKGDELVSVVGKKAADAAKKLRAAAKVASIASLARSNPAQVATVAQWDANPWLLGTPGGVVDLRTGTLHPTRAEDYITKLTAVTPAPAGTPAPMWQAFLQRIFKHDLELIPYLRRVAGYSATGLTTEHVLVFLWGQGRNGKGTFFRTLAYVLDDYAKVAPSDLLLETRSDRHPTDMAGLMGARLVVASEVPPGQTWNEPRLKGLTGGDPITARFMRCDFFTYMPQFTLVVAGNTKPRLRTVDVAIRKRVQMVPFLQIISEDERDQHLDEKLKAEAPAILRWMLDGCLEWQRQDLKPPKSVREASESYLEAEDVLGQWIDERCKLGGNALCAFDTLLGSWQGWCETNGVQAWSGTALSKALDERGFVRAKSGGQRGFRGIRVCAQGPFREAGERPVSR